MGPWRHARHADSPTHPAFLMRLTPPRTQGKPLTGLLQEQRRKITNVLWRGGAGGRGVQGGIGEEGGERVIRIRQ